MMVEDYHAGTVICCEASLSSTAIRLCRCAVYNHVDANGHALALLEGASQQHVQGAGMFVKPGSGVSSGTGADPFLDLSESQDQLQSLSCYASYVAYFYSNSSYPLRCDVRLPLPFPTLSVTALRAELGLEVEADAEQGALVNWKELRVHCSAMAG